VTSSDQFVINREREVTAHGCRWCWESGQPEIEPGTFHCQSQRELQLWNHNGCHYSFATLEDRDLHRASTGGCLWPENIPGMLFDHQRHVWYREQKEVSE
jgi:hypothetical protein